MYTKNGVCIEFNPADIPRIQNRKPRTISGSTSGSDQKDEEDKKDDFTVKESEFDKMSMIIGYNASDITYGQGSSTSGGFFCTSGHVTTRSMNREKAGVVECPALPCITHISRTLLIKRVIIFHFHLVLFQLCIFKMLNESILEHRSLHASLPML